MDEKLTLSLNDMTSLPNGAPLHVVVGEDKFSIGRHEDRDWVLPDPTRQISRHHIDIEFIKGRFYAIDRSAMGTRLASNKTMLQGPHPLQDGDVLQIGDYNILVRYGEIPQAPVVAVDSTRLTQDPAPAVAAMPQQAAPAPRPELAAVPVAAPAPLPRAAEEAMLEGFAKALGLAPADIAMDAGQLGTQIAEALRLLMAHLLLLEEERRGLRPGIPGTSSPGEINPLDGEIEADEAIAALFLAPAPAQMHGTEALLQSIERLVVHQRAQAEAQTLAVAGLLRGLAPDDVANGIDSGMFGSVNKSKAWDRYEETWRNKTQRTGGKMLELFRVLHGEIYQQMLTREAQREGTRRGA